MKCPACPSTSLVMTERSGIEIDYCPECRGVWLDRGELDKIIERSAVAPAPPAPFAPPPVGQPVRARRDDDDDDDDDDRYKYGTSGAMGKRRKKGLLGDLFDF